MRACVHACVRTRRLVRTFIVRMLEYICPESTILFPAVYFRTLRWTFLCWKTVTFLQHISSECGRPAGKIKPPVAYSLCLHVGYVRMIGKSRLLEDVMINKKSIYLD